jgi:hypothetical protein
MRRNFALLLFAFKVTVGFAIVVKKTPPSSNMDSSSSFEINNNNFTIKNNNTDVRIIVNPLQHLRSFNIAFLLV